MKSQDPLHFIASALLSPSLSHKCDNRIISIPKAALVNNVFYASYQTGTDDRIMNCSIIIFHSHPPPNLSLHPSLGSACKCHKGKVLTEGKGGSGISQEEDFHLHSTMKWISRRLLVLVTEMS